MLRSRDIVRAILIMSGLAAALFALIVPNSAYAAFLLPGANAKDLSFGPLLFRALLFFHGLLLAATGVFMKSPPIVSEETVKNKSRRTARATWLGLFVLCLIALALRLWNLNADLWVDEVFTLLDFVRQPMGEILTSFPSQNQHLLYSILAHFTTTIFGESAWALRLPAVLFGVASIWALFLLARRLLDDRAAVLACALMTVSYHHIWFSQNARGYTGLLFFTLLSTWLWLAALEKNSSGWWAAYTAAIVGGMWVHMTMAFVVASHGLVYLTFLISPKLSGDRRNQISSERQAGRKPLIAWVLSVTVTLQIYALALPEFLTSGLHEESKNSEWTNPLWVLTETLANLSIGFAGIAVVLTGAAFVVFGWWSLFRKNRRAAILMVLPPFFAGSLMLALGHNLFPRFFFFAMGFGLLIVIHGIFELPKVFSDFIASLRSKVITELAGVALALLLITVSIITVPRNYALPKQNFSGAKNYIENNRLPGERVVAVNIAGEVYSRYFAPQWLVAKSETELRNLEQNSTGNIWLVYTLSPEIKAFRPEMWRIIERNYKIVRVFPGTLNGGEIFVCRNITNDEKNNESSQNFGKSENNSVQQAALER